MTKFSLQTKILTECFILFLFSFFWIIKWKTSCVKDPQSNHPQVWWFVRRTHRTQEGYCCTYNYDLLHWKDTKQNQQRGKQNKTKRPKGVDFGRNHAETSRSSLPVESHRTDLIAPATNYDNIYEMLSTREAWLSLEVQFLLGADHVIHLCVTCTKIPDPRKKARLQHKPYCLYKCLSTMNYYSY